MLGSVEHEGTATIKLQKEGICQAFTITAFTSSYQAKLGSLCSGPPEHHSLHGVEDCTVSTYFHLHVVTFGQLLLFFSRLFRPGTSSLTLLPHDATGKSLASWRLALTQEAVRGFSHLGSVLSFLACPTAVVLSALTSRCGTKSDSDDAQEISSEGTLIHETLDKGEIFLYTFPCSLLPFLIQPARVAFPPFGVHI